MLQNNYDALDYKVLKQNYNLNMINFANTQTKFISLIPEQINKISRLTDKLSNITIIGGNTYYSKPGNKFEVIESVNVDFNNELNILKLAPSLVYKLEPKENLSKLISNKKIKNEYIIITEPENSEEWAELKRIFKCETVRSGGCKIGSSSDKKGIGTERVFNLKTFKNRVGL